MIATGSCAAPSGAVEKAHQQERQGSLHALGVGATFDAYPGVEFGANNLSARRWGSRDTLRRDHRPFPFEQCFRWCGRRMRKRSRASRAFHGTFTAGIARVGCGENRDCFGHTIADSATKATIRTANPRIAPTLHWPHINSVEQISDSDYAIFGDHPGSPRPDLADTNGLGCKLAK